MEEIKNNEEKMENNGHHHDQHNHENHFMKHGCCGNHGLRHGAYGFFFFRIIFKIIIALIILCIGISIGRHIGNRGYNDEGAYRYGNSRGGWQMMGGFQNGRQFRTMTPIYQGDQGSQVIVVPSVKGTSTPVTPATQVK